MWRPTPSKEGQVGVAIPSKDFALTFVPCIRTRGCLHKKCLYKPGILFNSEFSLVSFKESSFCRSCFCPCLLSKTHFTAPTSKLKSQCQKCSHGFFDPSFAKRFGTHGATGTLAKRIFRLREPSKCVTRIPISLTCHDRFFLSKCQHVERIAN